MSFGTKLLTDHAAKYGTQLLRSLGYTESIEQTSDHPAIAFRRSGLLKTTGLMLPAAIAAHADGALLALKKIANRSYGLPKNGSVFLGERARLRRTIRKDRICAGGYGRLMDVKDGRIALNLVREDDWDLIPAWLEDYVTDWNGITAAVRHKMADYLVDRAAEIGLAVAKEELPDRPFNWYLAKQFDRSAPKKTPQIVDLSGLWAGPLASSLMMRLGATVIKVEGPNRPDGMRAGHPYFYKLMNGGKHCVALNFKDPKEFNLLRDLLENADIVIEASRPRAFAQMGIVAEDYVARKPGKVWARLTAYGRDQNRIGFGDDIAISTGLSTIMDKAWGEPCFVGDALADPVNGLHLALAIWGFYQKGGGTVIDMNMRDCLRYALGDLGASKDMKGRAKEWSSLAAEDTLSLYTLRRTSRRVHDLGEDNLAVNIYADP